MFVLDVFRFMTCSCVLDYNTVAAADKFGNLAIVGLVNVQYINLHVMYWYID